MLDDVTARMALCALNAASSTVIAELLTRFEPAEVWATLIESTIENTWSIKARALDIEQLQQASHITGSRFITPSSQEWVPALDDLAGVRVAGAGEAPLGLWLLGPLALPEATQSVALVGSRSATSYGLGVTADLASELALHGCAIISGMAYGVDASAHRGALAVAGQTVAVLACGVDQIYPLSHAKLYHSIVERGVIVAEVPPGFRPQRAGFLARNRLIAALSAGVVVVEAAVRSGAKNTATWASHLRRVLMAIPGPVTSSMSATPHWLIQHGEAQLVSSAEDIKQLLGPLQPELELDLRGPSTPLDRLRPELRAVREAVPAQEPVSAAQICARVGITMPEALAILSELTDSRWLEETSPGLWALPARPDPSPKNES